MLRSSGVQVAATDVGFQKNADVRKQVYLFSPLEHSVHTQDTQVCYFFILEFV